MRHSIRKWITLIEQSDGMKLDDNFVDSDALDFDPAPVLSFDQQRMLDRHKEKQERQKFRSAEKRRRDKERGLYDPEYENVEGSRHVPKSYVGYKPFKWPMIRFGKFRDRSAVGFDAEMRREMGNKTHEAGVSCFQAMDYKGGYLILEHSGRPSWGYGFDYDKMLMSWAKMMKPEFDRSLRDGTPFDVFLLRGHLVSFGKNGEWLECGSDGEYLLDTRKPYEVRRIDPEHVWISHHSTLRQYYDSMPRNDHDEEL